MAVQVVISLKRFAQRCKDNVREERPAYNPTKGLQLTPAGMIYAMPGFFQYFTAFRQSVFLCM